MSRKYRVFRICFLFFCYSLLNPADVFAQDLNTPDQEDAVSSPGIIKNKPRYGIAITESIGSGLLLYGINRYIRNAPYAYVTLDSITYNLSGHWEWDQDEFPVNQLGHPYQGSFYYNAGRSNGLGFWSSTLLTIGSSALWELLGEIELPAYNDMITTTAGAISIGESFHRLYVVFDDMPYPMKLLKIVFSPFDAMNDAIFGKPKNRGPGYSGLYLDETFLSAGAGVLINRMDVQRMGDGDMIMPSGFFDLNIVYGDPYQNKAKVPYQNFEIYARLNLSNRYYSLDLFSNGDLFTLGRWENPDYSGALSLNLHYDFILGSLVNFSAHSLGITYKSLTHTADKWDISFKMHANFVFLGATEIISLKYGDVQYADPDAAHRDYDYTLGGGIKTYFYAKHPKAGTFNLSIAAYFMDSIDSALPENASPGFTSIGIINAYYEHEIALKWYMGIQASGYIKYGYYAGTPDVFETIQNYTIYAKKRF